MTSSCIYDTAQLGDVTAQLGDVKDQRDDVTVQLGDVTVQQCDVRVQLGDVMNITLMHILFLSVDFRQQDLKL